MNDVGGRNGSRVARAAALALAAAAWLLPAAPVAAQPPDSVRVRRGACPFECCQYGEWTAGTPIPAYAVEGEATAAPAFLLQPGESFQALDGNVHVERVGVVEVTRPVRPFTLAERPDQPELAPGDTIYVLDYLGEGYYRVWWAGTALTAEGFWARPGEARSRAGSTEIDGRLRVEPRARWWVHVRTVGGESGWIEMREGVRVAGNDACG